jgi:hypothetical protein
MSVDFVFAGLIVTVLLEVFPDGILDSSLVRRFVRGAGLRLTGDVGAVVIFGNCIA